MGMVETLSETVYPRVLHSVVNMKSDGGSSLKNEKKRLKDQTPPVVTPP